MLTGNVSFSLNELDSQLLRYLNYDHGFFIEAGANDGISQSNTLYFEKYKKWGGILIEPIPDLAKKCVVNRPNCIVENSALVPFDFNDDFIEMRYSNLMSLVKGAMKSEEEELKHVNKGCAIQGVESYEVKVPANSLSNILKKHGVETIDLFSLDVEGFELSVLKGIDFDRHHPKWMLIESRYEYEIESFLNSIYEPICKLSHHDVLFKHKSV